MCTPKKQEFGVMTQRDTTRTKFICAVVAIVASLATVGISSQALAAFVIDLPDITIPGNLVTPSNGVLEVKLTLTGAELANPPSVNSFNLDFTTDGSGLTFSAAQAATTSPLFTGGAFNSFGTSTNVQAAHDIVPSSVFMFNNAGLIKVPFTVAAGNVGTTYHLNWGPLNQLAYSAGLSVTTYPLTLINGSITVTSAVPEPPVWEQLSIEVLLVGVGMVVIKLRRRMRYCQ
jgi:hypothetical protein